MQLIYAQFEVSTGDICHYLLNLKSLEDLALLCFDAGFASLKAGIRIVDLVTFSPVYDELCVLNRGQEVELLEEEFYRGPKTKSLLDWLLDLPSRYRELANVPFGGNIPELHAKACTCDDFGDFRREIANKFIDNKYAKDNNSGHSSAVKTYILREIFCRLISNKNHDESEMQMFERILLRLGNSPISVFHEAVQLAIVETSLIKQYNFPDDDVYFCGVESIFPIEKLKPFPIEIARQKRGWPWKYDVIDYKRQLLSETIAVNTTRKEKGLNPFLA